MKPAVWKIAEVDERAVQELACALKISAAAARVYLARGLKNVEEVRNFQRVDADMLHDHFLMPGMDVAVVRLSEAIKKGENIHIVADSDVDGVAGAAALIYGLRRLRATVSYSILGRYAHGYGLRPDTIVRAKAAGADLLVAVDCGTNDIEAAAKARQVGTDLIVADHHLLRPDGEVPDVLALLNPLVTAKYPFTGLCGAGIAYKLVEAMATRLGYAAQGVRNHLLDYVALATVADYAPMLDENRAVVDMGCARMATACKPGIRELLRVAQVSEVDTATIAYALGPRINALPRLAGPGTALELLLATDEALAVRLVRVLDEANRWRQARQEVMFAEAMELLAQRGDPGPVPVVALENFHAGVAGLVARRVAHTHSCAAAVCVSLRGENGKGTIRSSGDFDVMAALNGCQEHITRFSGNSRAAWLEFPVSNLAHIANTLNSAAVSQPTKHTLFIDAILEPAEITMGTLESVLRLAPFGPGNLEPIFATHNLVVIGAQSIGNRKHLALRLAGTGPDNACIEAMLWGEGDHIDRYAPGTVLGLAFKMRRNTFGGQVRLQLIVEDVREGFDPSTWRNPDRADEEQGTCVGQTHNCDKLLRIKGSRSSPFMPDRGLFRKLSRVLRAKAMNQSPSSTNSSRFRRMDMRAERRALGNPR